MSAIELIQEQLVLLPPDKQREVLDFVIFLQQQMGKGPDSSRRPPLRQHPAFGSWGKRRIDSLEYQQKLRAEWDGRALG